MNNLNWVRKSVLAMILTVTAICIVGYFIDPELVGYTEEDVNILSKQKTFALFTLALGFFVGSLFYRK
jgi:hypothetical protein